MVGQVELRDRWSTVASRGVLSRPSKLAIRIFTAVYALQLYDKSGQRYINSRFLLKTLSISVFGFIFFVFVVV